MLVRHTLTLSRWRVSCLEQGTPDPEQPSLVLRHAIAIDLPGAGYSERNARLSPVLSSVSACVGEILERMCLDRPILVGHSHGGTVALHLAATEPALMRSLVLLASAHPYFRQADQIIGFYLSPAGASQ